MVMGSGEVRLKLGRWLSVAVVLSSLMEVISLNEMKINLLLSSSSLGTLM